MARKDTIWGVWRAALAIIGKFPLATLVPGAVLGAIGEIPAYLIEGRPLLDQALSLVTSYVAYYLYLAYAERIVQEAEQGTSRFSLRDVLGELRRAVFFVPHVLVAALIALAITSVATGLLVIPGMWIYTRWSLATPVIRRENVGAFAAMRRSNELVRGHFWFVFLIATIAFYVEGVVVHFGADVAGAISGSYTWGEWLGGSIVATLATPLAAFATSLVYSSLARRQE